MSRFILRRTGAALVLALGLVAAARAADPPAQTDKDAAENKRTVYIVHHRSAKDLAALLGPYFKGVAVVQAAPESFGDALLIRAAPAAFDEVTAAVEKLDRPPRTVSVEVLMAEAAPDAPEWKEGDFTGPAADVAAQMEDLRNQGSLTDLRRVRLTVVEGRPSSILAGESKPNVMGIVAARGAGIASRAISYRNVGSMVQASAAVSADGLVTVDLKFQDLRAYTPEDGVSIGADEKGKPVFATAFHLTTWDGKVDVHDGQARRINGLKKSSKSENLGMVLVVAAQVVQPDVKPEK